MEETDCLLTYNFRSFPATHKLVLIICPYESSLNPHTRVITQGEKY
ncbi:hypothetical protein [Varibaculum timonense]|nr:hypothetical protein [Varibaculum timonense]